MEMKTKVNYQVWFDEDEIIDGFESYEDLKEYFDICVKDIEDFGCITIETPVKRPYKIACYVFDEDDEEIDDDTVYDLSWEKEDEDYEMHICVSTGGCITKFSGCKKRVNYEDTNMIDNTSFCIRCYELYMSPEPLKSILELK